MLKCVVCQSRTHPGVGVACACGTLGECDASRGSGATEASSVGSGEDVLGRQGRKSGPTLSTGLPLPILSAIQ